MSTRERYKPWFQASEEERRALAEVAALRNRDSLKFPRPEAPDMTWWYAKLESMGPPLVLLNVVS